MVMVWVGAYVCVSVALACHHRSKHESLVNMITLKVKLRRTSCAIYGSTLLSTTALFSLFVEVNRSLF